MLDGLVMVTRYGGTTIRYVLSLQTMVLIVHYQPMRWSSATSKGRRSNMTLGQIENTMAMICNGRKVLWQGWVLSFDWAEGYLATKDNLSVACFDSLPDLLRSMKELEEE
jgi:hypothetical protein